MSNVNLTRYRTELSNIQNSVELIQNNCEELKLIELVKNASSKGNEDCSAVLYRLNILMNDIEETDRNLFGKDERVKRYAVNELSLDGWPEDHRSFFDKFSSMSARGSKTSTAPEQDTSYITSMLNTVGKRSEKNQMVINAHVAEQLSFVADALASARNGSADVVRLIELKATIQDIVSYQMLILTTFSSKQKQFLSILPLAGKKNAQMSKILAADTLLDELQNIRNVVSEQGLDFPMRLTSKNVHTVFQLSTPEITLFDDQIFLTVQLPLISKFSGNHFTLLKVTSALYNLRDNFYSFVVPNHEFIAIDALKEHYTTLTVDDLNKCQQISNTTALICKQTSPMRSILTSVECEIRILYNTVDESIQCRWRHMQTDASIFIKTLRPNTWLVTMPKSTKVRYMCKGKATQEFFTQINGLLTIDSNCKFAFDNVLITGHNSLSMSPIHERSSQNSFDKDLVWWIIEDILPCEANNISYVINFGDSEKLLQISYSREDRSHSDNIKLIFAWFLCVLIGIFFIVHLIFIIVVYRREAKLKKNGTYLRHQFL